MGGILKQREKVTPNLSTLGSDNETIKMEDEIQWVSEFIKII